MTSDVDGTGVGLDAVDTTALVVRLAAVRRELAAGEAEETAIVKALATRLAPRVASGRPGRVLVQVAGFKLRLCRLRTVSADAEGLRRLGLGQVLHEVPRFDAKAYKLLDRAQRRACRSCLVFGAGKLFALLTGHGLGSKAKELTHV